MRRLPFHELLEFGVLAGEEIMVLYVGPVDEPDKYELVEVRSRGGEGEVWKALLSVDSVRVPVAAKLILARNESEIDTWRERWGRQAELLRSLRHPGLVTVREVFMGPGPHQTGSANPSTSTLCLVMNWVEGPTLAEWTSLHPDRHALESMQVIGGMASAVDYLHSGSATGQPVLHRDIKPANVILAKDGPQLVDFGFVRTLQPGTSMTMVGTPAYISPEAAAGLEYTPASDRYSLGATAYFALTGEAPTAHDVEKMRSRLGAVRGLEGRGDLHDHILSMMNLDPNRRPTSAVGWAQSLAAMSVVGGPTRIAQPSPPPPPPTPTPVPSIEPGKPPAKRRHGLIWGIAAAVLVGIIAITALASRGSGGSDTSTTQAASVAATTDATSSTTTPTTTSLPETPVVPSVLGRAKLRRSTLWRQSVSPMSPSRRREIRPPPERCSRSPPLKACQWTPTRRVTLTVATAVTAEIPDLVGKSDSDRDCRTRRSRDQRRHDATNPIGTNHRFGRRLAAGGRQRGLAEHGGRSDRCRPPGDARLPQPEPGRRQGSGRGTWRHRRREEGVLARR